MAGFKDTCAAESRFERVASRNLIRNHQFFKETSETFSTCFKDPNAPLGPKSPTIPTQQQPKQWISFKECDERG